MISLLAAASPSYAADLLEQAARGLRNVQGASMDTLTLYNGYCRWAGEQMRSLATLMSTSELDRIVTTTWHWAITAMDLGQSLGSIRAPLDAQINETLRRLDEEALEIRAELARWDNGKAAAAVLDTNVLTAYPGTLDVLDWNTILDQRPPVPVVLALPLKAIDELDKLKLSNAPKPTSGGPALRDRARRTLKWIEETLVHPDEVVPLGTVRHAGEVQSPLQLALIRQDPRHVPLSDADAEIIARALSLEGYAKTIRLVTYDTGMILRARQAGLSASRPPSQTSAAS